MPRRIFAVIVLYRIAAEDSISYRSLRRAAAEAGETELRLGTLLYDNSPVAADPGGLPAGTMYVHDASNSGLARAYNMAIELAREQDFEWFLTLDQDTDLPRDFFAKLLPIVVSLDAHLEVAAVVPQIRGGGRSLSPNTFLAGAWPRWFASDFQGVPRRAVYAFNSGSLLRLSALRQIGGYSAWFWLDHSDAYVYRQLARFGKRVYVAGQIQVEHEFSMLNMGERISPERYRAMLLAESAFWDGEMNVLAGMERTARLIARMLKHRRRGDSAELRGITRDALRSRLFESRRGRSERWRRETVQRIGREALAERPMGRPMVSVCMAAYKGERYIEAQLRSIARQLTAGDEIVIVDDHSPDGTPDRIRAFRATMEGATAPRVLFVAHPANEGVVRTFEEAVRSATGDILFLADDDDVWAPGKVEAVLAAFAADPAVQVVTTGLTLIDDGDRPLDGTEFFRHRREFRGGLLTNLLHNQYQGSTMAFRSAILRHVLPFPAGRLFLHDAWIGTRNTLAGGGTRYLEAPLLLYRRHTNNFSRRLSRWKQVLLRLQLVGEHLRWFWHTL